MSVLVNLVRNSGLRIAMLGSGLGAGAALAGTAAKALMAKGGTKGERLKDALTQPLSQRRLFALLRGTLPNVVIGKPFIRAYENNGTAIVTRYPDVKEVLARDNDFAVVYEPRMRKITGGENFFLGMQDTPTYSRDTSNMRLAMRREDVSSLIVPFVASRAEELVSATGSRVDVPQDVSLRVPAQMLDIYFGTPGPSEREVIEWTTIMFWYLFIDLAADPAIEQKALTAARACCTYLDDTIRTRKASGEKKDDVLGRCLSLQAAGMPGMDDLGIRNNLIGLMIGAVPTISKAAVQALDQLLDRPEALTAAQKAAREDDDHTLAQCVFEALRFNPVNPVIYRRALRKTTIARGFLRARTIPEGTMVLASNLSAMFDPQWLQSPTTFRTDRPGDSYILWGNALHTCFGAHINAAAIPGILKPLLRRQGLRREEGILGRIDTGSTPFPQHFVIRFDS